MKPSASGSGAPLSICIICRNEAENMRSCLESVAWADEIVVIDSGSSDATVAIAREFTDRVLHHPWPGYIEQKNYALDQAKNDWVLCLDADERVSPRLAEEIRATMERIQSGDTRFQGFSMPRRTFYLGRWINHGGWYPSRKLRLFHRGSGRWAGINPHDHVRLEGRVAELQSDLEHYTYRDIADHLDTINRFTTVAAEEMFVRGRGIILPRMLFNPLFRWFRMCVLRLGFLDGMPGFIIAALASYYVFLKYAKLWELRRAARGGRRAALKDEALENRADD